MDTLNQVQQDEERVPLGRRLRQISNQANVTMEVEQFKNKLIAIAEEGKTSIFFPDLRTELPTFIQSGKYVEWFKAEEIVLQGVVRQDTGAYEFTVSW